MGMLEHQIIKSIFGAKATQKTRQNFGKALASIPKYSRPEEYGQMMDVAKQYGDMGLLEKERGLAEDKLGAAIASGVTRAEKYAPSSTAALGAVTDLYGQKMGAIRDLGIQFAQMAQQRRDAQLGAQMNVLGQGAMYSDREFDINQWYPSQLRLNMTADRMGQAMGITQSGVEGFGAAQSQMAGWLTQLMGMQGMSPQYGNAGQAQMGGAAQHSWNNGAYNYQYTAPSGQAMNYKYQTPKLGG